MDKAVAFDGFLHLKGTIANPRVNLASMHHHHFLYLGPIKSTQPWIDDRSPLCQPPLRRAAMRRRGTARQEETVVEWEAHFLESVGAQLRTGRARRRGSDCRLRWLTWPCPPTLSGLSHSPPTWRLQLPPSPMRPLRRRLRSSASRSSLHRPPSRAPRTHALG